MDSMWRGSQGRFVLGVSTGQNSAFKDIKRQRISSNIVSTEYYVSPIERILAIRHHAKGGLWREYCEDGYACSISPMDHGTTDDYEGALNAAKSHGKADARKAVLHPHQKIVHNRTILSIIGVNIVKVEVYMGCPRGLCDS